MPKVRSHVLFAVAAALSACSAADQGDEGEVSTDALVEGHGGITGPVDVQSGRLVVLREGNEGLLQKKGEVLVGGVSNSPHGFLRKALSAEVIDDQHLAISRRRGGRGRRGRLAKRGAKPQPG